MKEVTQVWNQFQRFAEYDDLKKLHTLVVPEVAKFEIMIQQNKKKIDAYEQLLKNFDEIIQTKSNKITVLEKFKDLEKDKVTNMQIT